MNAITFLIRTLFDLYLIVMMLRFLLGATGTSYQHPIMQFMMKVTQPVLKPLQTFMRTIKGFDTAVLLAMLVIKIVELLLLLLISVGSIGNPIGLLMASFGMLLRLAYNVYMFTLIARAILSWLPQAENNLIHVLLARLTDPVLKPFRRYIPAIAGVDLSPLWAIIAMQLLKMLVAAPIINIGLSLL